MRSISVLERAQPCFQRARVCSNKHDHSSSWCTFFFLFSVFFPSIDFDLLPNTNLHQNMGSGKKFSKKEKDKLGENMGLKLSQIMVYHYFIVCRQCGGSFVHFRANEIVLLLCSWYMKTICLILCYGLCIWNLVKLWGKIQWNIHDVVVGILWLVLFEICHNWSIMVSHF